MGTGKKTTETTPWAPAQPYILGSLQAVDSTFKQNQPALQGAASNFYDAYDRSAPGAETGINLAQGRTNATLSGQFAGQNPGRSAYEAAMRGRSTNDYMGAVGRNPAIDGLNQFADGGFVGQGMGADYFRRATSGEFVNNNPYLQQNIDYAISDAANPVNSLFASAGRFGGSAHQGTMAREAGRVSSQMRMEDLATERNRQQQAAGALDGLERSDRGMQMAAIGQQGEFSNADQQARLQAMGMDEDARARAQSDQVAAAGLLDQGYNLDQARMDAAMGSAQDLRSGNLGLLGNAAQLPWLGVQAQAGSTTQLSSPYSTTTQRSSPGLGNVLGGIAGGALSAAGSVGGFGTLFSEPGLKKNIKPLGVRPDGLGIYEYEYKAGTGLPSGRQTGVMADEVQQNRPDALGPTIGGARTVDYSKLQGEGMNGLPQGASPISVPDKDLKPSFGQKLDGWLGNAVNPDPNRKGAGLSLLGAAMMANAKDTPFEGIGTSILQARGGLADRQDQQQKFDIDRTQADALASWREAQAAADEGRDNRTAAQRTFEWFSALPPEQQAQARAMLPGAAYDMSVQQPLITAKQNASIATKQTAPGRAAVETQPRVGMSGGVPVVTSPAQFAALPSGATFKAPDGTIRRKP
jgi:hypothetical protein